MDGLCRSNEVFKWLNSFEQDPVSYDEVESSLDVDKVILDALLKILEVTLTFGPGVSE